MLAPPVGSRAGGGWATGGCGGLREGEPADVAPLGGGRFDGIAGGLSDPVSSLRSRAGSGGGGTLRTGGLPPGSGGGTTLVLAAPGSGGGIDRGAGCTAAGDGDGEVPGMSVTRSAAPKS